MRTQQYREIELTAARNSLARADSGQLNGRDVSPLLELFQEYGDHTFVAEPQSAVRQWNHYATLALAGKPSH